MFRKAVSYEASEMPLGSIISANAEKDTCPRVSAGHEQHEYTTGSAFENIIAQFGFNVPFVAESLSEISVPIDQSCS